MLAFWGPWLYSPMRHALGIDIIHLGYCGVQNKARGSRGCLLWGQMKLLPQMRGFAQSAKAILRSRRLLAWPFRRRQLPVVQADIQDLAS